MKYKSVTVTTVHSDADLVACAMFDAGAGGVCVHDRQDFLDLYDSDVVWDYVDEKLLETDDKVTVSTVLAFEDAAFLSALTERLSQMRRDGGITYGEIAVGEVDAADWENEWKKYYKPIVTPKITVVPTWIKYPAAPGERTMRLDPGMAFGTGGHDTTRMCLELMEAEGKDVADVGCGSGILGIAAAICGAKSVYMCDIDAQAVEFSRMNAKLNDVDCEIERADLLSGDTKADLIFANLTADILLRLIPGLKPHLNPGGRAVLSGIVDIREEEIVKCCEQAGFRIVRTLAGGDWRALEIE